MQKAQQFFIQTMQTISTEQSLDNLKAIINNTNKYANKPNSARFYTNMFKNPDHTRYTMPKEMSEAIKQAKKDTHPYINNLEDLKKKIRENYHGDNTKINALIEDDKKAYLLCVSKIQKLLNTNDTFYREKYEKIFNKVKSSQRITSAELRKNISTYITEIAQLRDETIEKK